MADFEEPRPALRAGSLSKPVSYSAGTTLLGLTTALEYPNL